MPMVITPAFLFSLHAHADVITCHFTEPYITIRHDTALATIEFSGLAISEQNHSGVGLLLLEDNQLQLSWGEAAKLILRNDGQGSDLMSDYVYPISARYFATRDGPPLVGGCVSTQLDKIISQEQLE